MADTYTPFSSASFPTRPQTWYTGMDMSLADTVMRAAQKQQMEHEAIRMQQSQANLDRYQGMTPAELAKAELERIVAQNASSNPNYAPAITAGKIGEAQQQSAKGRFDTEMVGSKIDTEKSTNQLKQLSNLSSYMDQHFNIIQAAEASGAPGGGQTAYGQFLAGLPPELRKQFPTEWNQRTAAGMQKLRQQIGVQSAEHQKQVDIHTMDNRSKEKIAEGNNRATVAAANARANRSIANPMVQFQEAIAKKDYKNVILYAELLLSLGTLNEKDAATVAAVKKQAERMWAEQMAKGQQAPFPGMPNESVAPGIQERAFPDNSGNAGPQRPRPGQLPPGVKPIR